MNRRRFNLSLAGACSAACLPGLALAQGAPVEGRDYARLAQPVAMPSSGKIEVVEFFGYWCPHCNSFEPAIDAWSRKLPAEVSFRRVPVAFSAPQEPYARIYLALEAMGQLDALHRKVFAAIHVQRQRLDKEADLSAFVQGAGGDGAKFVEAYKSFGVATKVRQAKQLSEAYKIDGVPTLGIHGRWFTSGSLAGTHEKALAVADALIQRARKG